MTVTKETIMEALASVEAPEMDHDVVALKMIDAVLVQDGKVLFTLTFPTPAYPYKHQLKTACEDAVKALDGVDSVDVNLGSRVAEDYRIRMQFGLPFSNVIAVASGKGGVGKSTMAVNLALALRQSGATVGLMDADVYGPNIPMMMGAGGRPKLKDKKIEPMETWGIKMMSMGFLLEEGQAVIWRGPMLHSAIQQFLQDVLWGALDYLIIDMPPGTGDVQLSLSQMLPITGAVIVTTPQDVALSDVRKGLAAFQNLSVPILGIIENMSYFLCPHCGDRTDIFSTGGGQKAAEELGVPFLGEVAIDPAIRAGGDDGQPIVGAAPHSPQAKAITEIAGKAAARLAVHNLGRQPDDVITITEIGVND